MTGTRPVAMRSLRTLPAPTLGSWSVSPTSRRWARAGTACSRAEASRGVEHRGLVHDEEVGGERVGLVAGEAAAGGVVLEQAVDGGGEAARGLGQALGGAAGRGREVHADLLRLQDLDEGAEDGGLARAGPAGEDAELRGEREADRDALQLVEGKARLLLGPLHGGVGLDRRQPAADPAEALDDVGDLLLGAVVVRQLEQAGAGQRVGHAGRRVADQRLGLDQGLDAGGHELARGLQLVGRVFDQVGLAERRVALLLQGLERVEDAGVEPRRRVVGKAEVDGDAVGGLEPDAVNLAGDAVRLVHQNLLRLRAEVVDELHALRGRHAVGLEEDVQLALGPLLVPRALDRRGALLADALDVAQPAGLLAEDAEGVGPERVHDLVGVDLADAWHEPAAEVLADAVDGGGELGLKGRDLELRAVLRVPGPLALEVEGLAAFHAGQRAHDGDLGRGVRRVHRVGPELCDRVVVLLVEKDDALEDAGEGGRCGGGHGWPEKSTVRGSGNLRR